MRSGSGLGMILHGERRLVCQADSFNRFVIKVNMGDLDIGFFPDRFRIYAKSMVLGGDLASSRYQVFDRVIQSPMSMVHFKGRDIIFLSVCP